MTRMLPWLAALALAVLPLAGQGAGMDFLTAGPLAVHDHIVFDYHFPIKGDPYPHEVKEGYAFDGVDLGLVVGWHWGRTHLRTSLRASPLARSHFAYDQDTDFEPGTNFTHGDEGVANSRTLGVDQELPLGTWSHVGTFSYDVNFMRQGTAYGQVITYDLNTNPQLPSDMYSRHIAERAIVYELRPSLLWRRWRQLGAWQLGGELGLTPLTAIFLRNYIPDVLAATSTQAYGVRAGLTASHALGAWRLELGASGGWYNSYRAIEGFRREEFRAWLGVRPPRLW